MALTSSGDNGYGIKIIKEFRGPYYFLSNYYSKLQNHIVYEDISYPTSEHAYAASKTLDIQQRLYISTLKTPGSAKQYGRKLTVRNDWEDVKKSCMAQIVWIKFRDNPDLASRLLATGDAILQEGNIWGDVYWGVDLNTGIGQNYLGRILMVIRSKLRNDPVDAKFLSNNCSNIDDKKVKLIIHRKSPL